MKKHQIDFNEAGVYDTRNPLNNLTGKQWLFSTKSVIPIAFEKDKNIDDGDIRNLLIPDKLAMMLIQTFTKAGESLFDPFANYGSFLLGASQVHDYKIDNKEKSHRKAIGIFQEDSKKQLYEKLCLEQEICLQKSYTNSLKDWLDKNSKNKKEFFNLITTEIPIWNETQKNTNYYGMNKTNFEFSSIEEINNWKNNLSDIFSKIVCFLKENRYIVIVVGIDIFEEYIASKNIKESFDISIIVKEAIISTGVLLKSEIIWFEPTEEKKDFNLIRKKIFVFKKEF